MLSHMLFASVKQNKVNIKKNSHYFILFFSVDNFMPFSTLNRSQNFPAEFFFVFHCLLQGRYSNVNKNFMLSK